jgi:TonB-linked SusC/RagA family outer membrane protein
LTSNILHNPVTIVNNHLSSITETVSLLTNNLLFATPITGKVTNEKGEPVTGAGIKVKGSSKGTVTNEKGEFQLDNLSANATLVISFIGYEPQEIKPAGRNYLQVQLKLSVSELDQVQIIAYGTTTKRLNTGDVSKITSEEIEKQPVSNVLAALEGRVPGLIITQANGLPGSAFKVQLRGQSSIGTQAGTLPANNPLFIVDGVPYAPNNNAVSNVGSALGTNGVSPLIGINLSDIESVEVLKDADATSIYGSRGANGVILITTKKGKSGKISFNANIYSGSSHILPTTNLLNTKQYVQMRKEALKNDGQPVNSTTAPDLVLWDTTKYTDFKKQFIGNNAQTTDAQASVSGGSAQTQFLVSGGYHHETTVYPTDLGENRASVHLNLNTGSADQKFKLNLNTVYVSDKNTLPSQDLANGLYLAPDAPSLWDSSGKLNWQQNGLYFTNPLSFLNQPYTGNTANLLGNLQLSYLILPNLTIRLSAGYNTTDFRELTLDPKSSQSPNPVNGTPIAFHFFGDNYFKSWILEPQLEYNNHISKGKITILAGGTQQENKNDNNYINANGYSSDALIGSLSGATSISGTSNTTQYRYVAVFGRINYNWQDKYIINLAARRDGSSRFGPGRQFGNFGSVGAAWIFSNEPVFKNRVSFLSFGKLRASYGTTGNDQIGDYLYYDTWSATPYVRTYGTISPIQPTRLFNPDFQWEINKKLETAIDLGFFQDRISLSAVYFRNRSSNQLIAYTMPLQTGFTSLAAKNFPALVQNSGFEFSFLTNNIHSAAFSWTSSIILTIPKNELVAFPGLANTPYSTMLTIGKPLHEIRAFQYLGVNPATGIFQFASANGPTATPSYPQDSRDIGTLDPKYYGGFSNTFSFKGLQLDIFFEGRKQLGNSYLIGIYNSNPPGTINRNMYTNEPVTILDRWQKPGDQAVFQQFTATSGTSAYSTLQNFYTSSAGITDASFIRLKTVALSYQLPNSLLKKWKIAGCKIYVNGQNLLTITKYKVADPESQSAFTLPPLRTITGGIQFNF